MSKAKGNRYEKQIEKYLEEATGFKFSRSFASGGQKQKGDVICVTPGVTWPFVMEVKHRESWQMDQLWKKTGEIWKWWDKVKLEASSVGKFPLLFIKKNRRTELTLMEFDPRFYFIETDICMLINEGKDEKIKVMPTHRVMQGFSKHLEEILEIYRKRNGEFKI